MRRLKGQTDYEFKPQFTLGADKSLCTGNKFVLKPTIVNEGSQNGLVYLWQDGSIDPVYTISQQGVYRLELRNICGSSSDEIKINKGICDLFIPNAFSPNGDSKNDLFKVGHGDNISEFEIQIFNRFGQLLFETKDKSSGWDGKVRGMQQQEGTYTWMIKYKTVPGSSFQTINGTVILLK